MLKLLCIPRGSNGTSGLALRAAAPIAIEAAARMRPVFDRGE
jgi:hypothetical protein